MSSKNAQLWGSPEYIKSSFTGIDSVTPLSRKAKAVKAVKAAVAKVSSARNNLKVGAVYKVGGKGCDSQYHEGTAVCLTFGLNGTGRQAHYFDALAKLVRTGEFCIFDINVDAVDDVGAVLCDFMAIEKAAAKADGKSVKQPAKKPAKGGK